MSQKFFPDEKVLENIRQRLSDTERTDLPVAMPSGATELEQAKYRICQLIARHKREENLLQDDLARIIGVDKSRISEIMRGKIEHFTLDRLIQYSQKIVPEIHVQIVVN